MLSAINTDFNNNYLLNDVTIAFIIIIMLLSEIFGYFFENLWNVNQELNCFSEKLKQKYNFAHKLFLRTQEKICNFELLHKQIYVLTNIRQISLFK